MRRKAGDDHHKHDDDDDNCNGGDDDDDGGGVGDNDDLEQQLSQGELWNQTLLEPPRSSVPGCEYFRFFIGFRFSTFTFLNSVCGAGIFENLVNK